MTPTDMLGNIKLYNADNMEVMKTFKDKQFDLAIVDPPYNLKHFSVKHNRSEGSKYRKSMQKLCDNSHRFNENKPNKEYWAELSRVSKAQIIFGANNFNLPETEYFLVWSKEQTVENFSSAELAFVYGIKQPAKVFTYQIHKHNQRKISDHSSEKPVDLYKWLLQNYAKEGNTILDTHFGSLSIGIACHDMKFNLTAIELDKDYYEQAKQRLINHQRQLTLF